MKSFLALKTLRYVIESFKVMFIKNPQDYFTVIEMSPMAKKNSKFSIFMDIFRITFTPMSIVIGKADDTHWKIHTVVSGNKSEKMEVNNG